MSGINEWRGDAIATTAESLVTVRRAVPRALYQVAIPGRSTVSYRALADDTTGSIADALADALSAAGVTVLHDLGAPDLRVFGPSEGVAQPVNAPAPGSSYVERVVAGRIPTPAETVVTLPETTTGGTWSLTVTTASGASATASGIAYNADPATLKAALDGLANLTALGADVEVSIETTSPRAYRIKWEGTDLSGTEVTATASGAGLLGNASAEIAIVQRPGAETPAVWQVYAIDDGEGGQDVTVVVDGVEYSATAEQIASESYWNSKFAGGVSGFQSAAIPEPGTARNGYVAAFSVLSDEALSVSPDYFGGYAAAQAGFQQLQEFEDEAGASEWVFFGDGGGETRRYTIGGNETGDVTANTSISAAIEALAQFESGDTEEAPFPLSLVLNSSVELPIVLGFTGGDAANTNVGAITVTTGTAPTPGVVAHGAALSNTIQAVALTAEGGTFKLSESGNDSASIAYGASAATVETAVDGISSVGADNSEVSGSGTIGDPYLIEFVGDLAQDDIDVMTVDVSSLTGGKSITVADPVGPVPGVNEIQRVSIDPAAIDGVVYLLLEGRPSSSIDYNASASAVDTALEAAQNIGSGNVDVQGAVGGPFLVEFIDDLKWQPLSLLQMDQDSLTIDPNQDPAIDVDETQQGTGPNHFNNPANWSLGHVLNSGERGVFASGSSGVLYGMRQRSAFTFDSEFNGEDTTETLIVDADFVDGQILRYRGTGLAPTYRIPDDETDYTLDDETDLYVLSFDPHSGRLSVALSDEANEPLTFTDGGDGEHYIELRCVLEIHSRYTGQIGLPQRDSAGFFQDHLPQYLAVGLTDQADNVVIGLGDGSGSGRIKIDSGLSRLRALVIDTGGEIEAGVPPVLFLTEAEDSEVTALSGQVGVAVHARESSTLARVEAYNGASVTLGPDVSGMTEIDTRGGGEVIAKRLTGTIATAR